MRSWFILVLLAVLSLGLWGTQLFSSPADPSYPHSTIVSEPTDDTPSSSTAPDVSSLVYGGIPQPSSRVLVRNGYVLSYDEQLRIPRWVAYRVEPDFLNTPPRSGRFERFRDDPDLDS